MRARTAAVTASSSKSNTRIPARSKLPTNEIGTAAVGEMVGELGAAVSAVGHVVGDEGNFVGVELGCDGLCVGETVVGARVGAHAHPSQS